VVVLILFHNAPRIGGSNVHEVAFLYGLSALAFSLADLLVGHIENLPPLVRDGTFDLILVRPAGASSS
jgi:ABC-2 type transport system permease protein